ncbi:MAG: ParA family protein [Acidimicrobiia bacterium]
MTDSGTSGVHDFGTCSRQRQGRSGQTTTAVNLAAILAEDRRVLLVDADPQRQARPAGGLTGPRHRPSTWLRRPTPGSSPGCRRWVTTTPSWSTTPPRLESEALRAVVDLADLVVCPSPPAALDLAALVQTIKAVIGPAGTTHRVLLTQVEEHVRGGRRIAAVAGH